jgi:uncharacterized protein (TIGR03000 family)
MSKAWLSAILSVAVLPAVSDVGSAAPTGKGGHSSSGHGSGPSVGRGPGPSAGHGTGGAGYYRGNYGGSGYYRGNGYGRSYYPGGIYLGLGLSSYGPSVYPDTAYYGSPGVSPSYYYSPPAYGRAPVAPDMPPDEVARAVIEVRVPPEAEIWFEGDKTTQTGSARTFVTPDVPPGQLFTYDVRARWTGADGKVVDLTRAVQFRAGQRLTIDFTRR